MVTSYVCHIHKQTHKDAGMGEYRNFDYNIEFFLVRHHWNYLDYVRQACALVGMQRPVQPLGEPVAEHLDLFCVPWLHGWDAPEVVRDLLLHLVHVAADEGHVLLAKAAPVTGNVVLVLKEKLKKELNRQTVKWSFKIMLDKIDNIWALIIPSSLKNT